MKARDVLPMGQFGRAGLEAVFRHTDLVRGRSRRELGASLSGRILVSAFYEPSTRTRMSFESAMLRLGGQATGFSDAETTRAGGVYQESLGDTAVMLSHYGDLIVLRHPETGACRTFASYATVPVINAGDGHGEHPTQALADLYTAQGYLGILDGAIWVLGGYLRCRSVTSLLLGLRHFDSTVRLVHPDGMGPDPAVADEAAHRGCRFERWEAVQDALPGADILYMHARFRSAPTVGPAASEGIHLPSACRADLATLKQSARAGLRVLNPLPRLEETATDLDASPFNGYWEQAHNAVYVRMALLETLLGTHPP